VGRQQIFSLADLPEQKHVDKSGRAVYSWDWAQVRPLYEKHPMRVERSEAHWKAIGRITSCTRAQWVDPKGKVLAYLAVDRGHDLQGIVHEWGGAAGPLYNLVCDLLHKRPGLHWLSHPRMPDPISPLLGEPVVDGGLALFKALDPAMLPEHLEN